MTRKTEMTRKTGITRKYGNSEKTPQTELHALSLREGSRLMEHALFQSPGIGAS